MKAHWNTPVYCDGYLYGCSGRNSPDAELRCIEWKTGNVMWSVPTRTHISLTAVNEYLVGLEEGGTLLLIKQTPRACEVVAHADLHDQAGQPLRPPCWAAPVLSHGLLYVRSKDRLLCLDLLRPED